MDAGLPTEVVGRAQGVARRGVVGHAIWNPSCLLSLFAKIKCLTMCLTMCLAVCLTCLIDVDAKRPPVVRLGPAADAGQAMCSRRWRVSA